MSPADFLSLARTLLPKVKALREAMHAEPELSFQEEKPMPRYWHFCLKTGKYKQQTGISELWPEKA